MRPLDDEERFRDERAATLRERDRGREPPPVFRPIRRDLAARDELMTRLADLATENADDKVPRPPGCTCHWEVGDSPCAVHPSDDDLPGGDR